MREIKFRAWDVQNEIMTKVSDISFGDDGSALTITFQQSPNPAGEFYRGIVHGENGILMQFTGLKDKNGVEIYDGDVLATSNDGKDGCDKWEEEIIGDVYWNDTFACWNHRIDLDDDQSIYSLPYIYVIGNICEHPELLKEPTP